jgi:ketosteroid isomerase-like protein
MADDSALSVAQQAWDRWIAADLDGFIGLWDPSGVWTMPGHSQIAGVWRGHDEIRKVAQIAFEVSAGTMEASPLELAATGDVVLGRFHVKASRPGATLDQDALQRFEIRGGKMASLLNLWTDIEQMDNFFR